MTPTPCRLKILVFALAPLLTAQVRPSYRIDTIAGTGNRVGDNGPAAAAYLRNPVGIARDANGRLYVADSGNHRVRRIDPDGTIRSIAGTGVRGVEGDDGLAVDANLWEPRAVAVTADGSVLIGDGSGRIRKVTADGRINTIIGNGQPGYSGDGGPALEAAIGVSSAILVDTAGNVYISNIIDCVVRKVTPGGVITTIAGTGVQGFSGDGGPATKAQLFAPLGLAINSAGNLLISDYGNLRIREVLADGTIRTVAGGGQGGDGSLASNVFLGYPCSLASDGAGTLYVGQFDGKIRKIDSTGVTTTIASVEPLSNGTPMATLPPGSAPCGLVLDGETSLYATDGDVDVVTRLTLNPQKPGASTMAGRPGTASGLPLEARFLLPQGLAVAPIGDHYFVDTEAHRVLRFSTAGSVSVVAGSGVAGFAGDGGPATKALLTAPAAVAVDPAGNLWIADSLNRRIRKVSRSGLIETVASPDAVNAEDRISIPIEIASDTAGNIYFLELDKHTVRKIDPGGKITLFAGAGAPGYAGDGGPATDALLKQPVGLGIDSQGQVYIADAGNRVVRRVNSSGTITTVAGGGSLQTDGILATTRLLANPVRVAADAKGNILIAEEETGSAAGRILQVDPDGIIWSIAGNGLGGIGGNGGLATKAGLGVTRGVLANSKGLIYLTDAGNRLIRRLTPLRPAGLRIAGGDQQIGAVKTAPVQPLAVFVGDPAGIPLPGIEVKFTTQDGSLTALDNKALTDINGIAMSRMTFGAAPGPVTVVAAVDGVGQAQFTATATAPQLALPPEVLDYTVATVAGSATAAAQNIISFVAPSAVAVDAGNTIYVADSGASAVRAVGASGQCATVAGTPSAICPGQESGSVQLTAPSGVATDVNGNLYFSDRLGHRIYRVSPDKQVNAIAGTGVPGFSGDEGAGTAAQLNQPGSLLFSRSGELFVSDSVNRRIRAIRSDGTMTTFAGSGSLGKVVDGGFAKETPLVEPAGMAELSSGTVLIVDRGAHLVLAIGAEGIVKILAGIGRPPTAEEDKADEIPLALDSPSGIAVLDDGTLYIGERRRIRSIAPDGSHTVIVSKLFGDVLWPFIFNGRLHVLDADNGVVRRLEADGSFTDVMGTRLYGDGGPASESSISRAAGLAEDAHGNLYFTDTLNHRVRRIDTAGVITTVAGTGEPESSGDGALATEAGLDSPSGIAVGADGSIYIAETRGARIRRISPDGIITTIAGTGIFEDFGDDGPARAASFISPAALALDSEGNLFVADSLAGRVRKITPDGVITGVAGKTAESDSLVLSLRAAETGLNGPSALAVDQAGNLYIADTLNNQVLKVFRSGAIARIAGTGQRRSGFTGGPALETPLNWPSGVAVDPAGNILITDGSQRVLKVSPTGIIETIAGRGTEGSSGDGGQGAEATFRDLQAILVNSRGEVIVSDQGNGRIRKLSPAAGQTIP